MLTDEKIFTHRDWLAYEKVLEESVGCSDEEWLTNYKPRLDALRPPPTTKKRKSKNTNTYKDANGTYYWKGDPKPDEWG